jgi:predicted DNA-binding transcriptional regulator AlpA
MSKKLKSDPARRYGEGKTGQVRLMSKLEVCDVVGVSFPTLWQWMRDGKFPRSRELGGKTCWLASEVEQWIIDRPVRRLKGDPVEEKKPIKWSS